MRGVFVCFMIFIIACEHIYELEECGIWWYGYSDDVVFDVAVPVVVVFSVDVCVSSLSAAGSSSFASSGLAAYCVSGVFVASSSALGAGRSPALLRNCPKSSSNVTTSVGTSTVSFVGHEAVYVVPRTVSQLGSVIVASSVDTLFFLLRVATLYVSVDGFLRSGALLLAPLWIETVTSPWCCDILFPFSGICVFLYSTIVVYGASSLLNVTVNVPSLWVFCCFCWTACDREKLNSSPGVSSDCVVLIV